MVGISVASLAVGWFVYDGICRSRIGQRTTLLVVVGFLWILAAFEARVGNNRACEIETAIDNVCHILRFRLEDRLQDRVGE
ncbi:MAG: urate hydroxylase PuuD [Proteobacteria bacterium]|nr:urate hydroxylase PuuD [Pseudomonadota bacterium]